MLSRFLVLLILIFGASNQVLAGGDTWDDLNLPTAPGDCRGYFKKVSQRLGGKTSNSPAITEFDGLLDVYRQYGPESSEVKEAIGKLGYPDIFLSNEKSKVQAKTLSERIHAFILTVKASELGHEQEFSYLIPINNLNDRILKGINPDVKTLNIFLSDDLQAFLDLSKKVPVDAEGRILDKNSPVIPKMQAAMNAFLQHLAKSVTVYAKYAIDESNDAVGFMADDAANSAGHFVRLSSLLESLPEVNKDYQAALLTIFNLVPSTEIIRQERFTTRVAASQKSIEAVLANLNRAETHITELVRPVVEKIVAGAAPAQPAKAKPVQTLGEVAQLFDGLRKNSDLQNEYIQKLSAFFSNGSAKLFMNDERAQRALLFLNSGLMKEGNEMLKKFTDDQSIPKELRVAVYNGVAAASKSHEIAWILSRIKYGGGENGLPLEHIMVKAWAESNLMVKHDNQPEIQFLHFRLPQVMAARTVLRYGNLVPTSKVLEVGYGTAGILNGLTAYIRPGNAVGIDVIAPPAGYEKEAAGVQLIHGNAPLNSEASQQVIQKGPYAAIYGVDVFKGGVSFGKKFDPGVSHAEYLKWAAANLEEGGVFIALNDFEANLVFSEAEMNAVGLQKVREEVYVPTARERPFLPADAGEKGGNLKVYVYRKGTYNLYNLGRDSRTGKTMDER